MIRILMISKMPPYPPTMGGNQRANLIHRALSRHGVVDLLLVQDPAMLPRHHLDVLKNKYGMRACVAPLSRGQYGGWRILYRWLPRMADLLAHHLGSRALDFNADDRVQNTCWQLEVGHPYDLVVGLELKIFFKSGVSSSRPHIIDLIDLDTDYYRSRLENSRYTPVAKYLLQRHLTQLEVLIPSLLKKTKFIWVANPNDLRQPALKEARVLPNIPFVEEGKSKKDRVPPADGFSLLFVGSFYHSPNIEGINRFLCMTWPRVLQQCPDAELMIYGVGAEKAMCRRFQRARRVRLLDLSIGLEEAYRQCAFTIAPIYSGAGTCFKVIESLAIGRTIVLTPYAARGYESVVRHGNTAWIGDTDEALAEGCVRLLADRDLRNHLAESGVSLAGEAFNYDKFQKMVDQTLSDLFGSCFTIG